MRHAAIDLHVAGLRWHLQVDDGRWRDALLARYAPFFAPASSNAGGGDDIDVILESTDVPDDLAGFWRRVVDEPFACTRGDGEVIVTSASTRVTLDLARRRIAARGPLNRHLLDVALRTALPFFVDDALLVHAALLCDGERGWVAAGPSGCGKTTLAALFPQQRGCDELVLVQRTGAAAARDARWRAHALPFWHGRPWAVRLAGLHLLRHGASDSRRRLGAGEAMRRLTQQVVWPDADATFLAAAWQRLGDLVAAVPAYELSFRPTPRVWDLLAAEAAA